MHYDWTRYWCPRDDGIVRMDPEGYATDPSTMWGRTLNPDLVTRSALRSRHFGLTAAHVTDELVKRGNLLVGGTETIVEVKPQAFGTEIPSGGTRDHDRTDLAFFEFTDSQAVELGDVSWVTPDRIQWRHEAPGTPVAYLATGYPAKKSRRKWGTAAIKSTPFAYANVLVPPETYKLMGLDPEINVVIQFDREDVVSRAGRGVPMVKPKGMSGGALWQFDSLVRGDPRHQDLLAGILIEWHREPAKVMVATRAHIALALIAKIYPELQLKIAPTDGDE